jgi:protein-disulfide isomerase
VPKEPRPRANRKAKNSGDTVTRNIVIGMIALVLLSGSIFTVIDKRSSSEVALPTTIETLDASNNGAPLLGKVLPENDYGISFNDENPLRIDIWEDFQCPYCKFFETAMNEYLETLVRDNQAQVVYHMASFLGQESVRAANAVNCAVSEGRFIEYHRALYDVQSGENSGIFSNKNLVEIGKRLGISSPEFASCVNDLKFAETVANVGKSMKKNGVEGTPTVFINGKPWNRTTAEFQLAEFKAAVEAARQ